MPLWGIDNWVPLGDLFVDVNILESLSSNRRSELGDLWQDFTTGNSNYRSLDRIGLGNEQERVSGLSVLERDTNLMVVGKPGSGKTTYLQRIVTECNNGKLQAQQIPVLIKLREFVDDGRKYGYNLEQFLRQLWELNSTDIELVLNQGLALVLLDGLDEVTGEAAKQIAKEIKRFTRAYPHVQVVVTCRTQSQESRFDRFDYVEVADFNEEQVRAFAAHWFETVCGDGGDNKARDFLEQLFREENKPIRELAITPILLSLTCAVFQQTGKFYSKRSKLYEEGLELLLVQWDKSREVERDQVYRDLSMERKLELLSYVALKKFEQEKYVLFEQEELEGYIGEFLGIDRRESQGVLRAIASQHGLLIERSHKVWSFSHLTFQEYLVAKWFCDWGYFQRLASHIIKKHWREVFLLAVGIINNADNLLRLIQTNINQLVNSDEKLQQFLRWIYEKYSSSQIAKSSTELWFFYFNLGLAIELDIINLELLFRLDIYVPTLEIKFYTLALEKSIESTLQSGKNYSAFEWNLPEPSSDYIRSLNPEMLNSFKQIISQLPKPPDDKKDTIKNQEWWQVYEKIRIEKTRTVMIKYRNIAHDWQFIDKHKQLLKQYYDANKLLVDCMNNSCVVSNEARKVIEDTLLFPIFEI
jgi:predicted NACHT family NTPase